jgi:hypothetical protein
MACSTNNASADPKTDFQFNSLHVFENKKWWSEFQDQLSKQKITTAHGVRVLLHQFINENESEIESECQLKRKTTDDKVAASSSGSVFERFRNSLQSEGHRRARNCSAYSRHSSAGSSPMNPNDRPTLGLYTVPTKGEILDETSDRSWGQALLGRRASKSNNVSASRSVDGRMTLGFHSVAAKGDTSRSLGALDDSESSERSWGQALLGRKVPKTVDASASRRVGGLDESERSWGAGCLDDSFRNMDEYQSVIRGDTEIFSVLSVATKDGDSGPSLFKRRGSHNSLDYSDRSINSLVSRLSDAFSMNSLVAEIDVPIDEEDGSSCSSGIDSFYKFGGDDFYLSQFDDKSALSLEVEGCRDNASVGSVESDYEDHHPCGEDGNGDDGNASVDSGSANNGQFEFPSASRELYNRKSQSSQSSSVNLPDASDEATNEPAQPPQKKAESLYEDFCSNRSRGSSITGFIRRVARSANLDLRLEGAITKTILKPPAHRDGKLKAGRDRDKSTKSVLVHPEKPEPEPIVELPKSNSVLIDWGDELQMQFDTNGEEESDASDFASEMATINSNEMSHR